MRRSEYPRKAIATHSGSLARSQRLACHVKGNQAAGTRSVDVDTGAPQVKVPADAIGDE